jgi:Secretion system C-terminal sorting domain
MKNIKSSVNSNSFLVCFLLFLLFNTKSYSQCIWDTISDGAPDMQVNTIYEDTLNHRLLVGGEFYTVGNSLLPAGSIGQFDGTTWSVIGAGAGGGSEINDFEYYKGILYAGGKIGINFPGLVTYNPSSSWAPFWEPVGGGIGNGGIVNSLTNYNNKLYMGGIFTIGSSNNVGYWDGNNYGPAGTGIGPANSGFINELEVYNGHLYAAGQFSSAGGINANNIAKYDGITWSNVDLNGSFNSQVVCLKVFNNELYAGGYFTMVGSTPSNRIAKWNGTSWSAVGSGFDDVVMDLNVVNGELYAGGYFLNSGNIPVRYIAKWDGSTWTQTGNTLDAAVFAVGSLSNKLYIGGQFYNPVKYFTTCSVNSTSIENIQEEKSLAIYPSPVSSEGLLNINLKNNFSPDELLIIELYNLSGQIIFSQIFPNNELSTIDLKKINIHPGVYIFSCKIENKRFKKRLIVY